MTGAQHIHWPPLLIACLLAAITLWLNQLDGKLPVVVDTAGFTHDPDYYVLEFDALVFDPQGKPLHSLRADRLIHYMDDDTTVLDNPVYQATDTRGKLVVRSHRALLSADNRHVHFFDEVVIVRTPPGDRPPLSLRTEYLHVTPDARTLRTDKPVELRQGASIITASALFADGNRDELILTGTVRGHHEPQR